MEQSETPKKRKRKKKPVSRFRHNFTLPEETIEFLKTMVADEDVSSMSEGVEFCVKYYKTARAKFSKTNH